MTRKPLVIVAIAAAALVGLVLLKNVIAQAALVGGVQALTGLRVSVGGMDVGLLRTSIGIRGVRIANPRGFTDPVMVDLPELYVDYRLLPLLTGRVHLDEVRLHLREVVVEKNAAGWLNLTAIPAVRQAQETAVGPRRHAIQTATAAD